MEVAEGCRPTGQILAGLIREQGPEVRLQGVGSPFFPTGIVCWGMGYTGSDTPALNANAGQHDKLAQFRLMQEGGVHTPDFIAARHITFPANTPPGVWFGRQLRHHGGSDISLVLQPEDFEARRASGSEFFTKFIPNTAEYRVWIYRRKHLGTYVKVLAHPEQYRGIGRNYDNGFSFNLVDAASVPRPAVDMAAQAVTSLGLDFGAVDMLLGKDGQYYVLEVNTAPGVEGDNRQVIQALARKIARWVALGYPRRAGTGRSDD
jgi:hypothetical protein